MAELSATASPVFLQFSFDRTMRALQRIVSLLALFHIFWSIALTSGLLTGLATRLLGTPALNFNASFWLIQQAALRVLIALAVLVLIVGTISTRDSRFFGRAAVGVFGMA